MRYSFWLASLAFLLLIVGGCCLPSFSLASSGALDFDLFAETPRYDEESSWSFITGGFLETREQYGLEKGKFFSTRQKAFAELKASRDFFSLYVSGEAEVDPARSWEEGPDSNVWRVAPKEAYMLFEPPAADIFLGYRIVTWGTGDGVNLLDLFNPDDTRDPAADVRIRAKRPVPMGQVVLKAFSPWVLEGIIMPWGQVNKDWPEHSPWTPNYICNLRAGEEQGLYSLDEDDSVSGAESGLKLSSTLGSWDVALVYFNGFIDASLFEADPGHGSIREKHPRMQAYGAMFATGFWSSTFRGELAFKPKLSVMSASGGIIRSDYLEGVLGLDYTFGENFYVNVQYFCKAALERRLDLGGMATLQGITFSVSDKFMDDALEAGIKGLAYVEGRQGQSLQIYTNYSFQDHWKAMLSFTFWDGDEQGALGQDNDNDMLSVSLRYSF